MKIDAISVKSKNFKETVKFYTLLGFTFPPFDESEDHLEPITKEGDVRLMIDTPQLLKDILGKEAKPSTHSSFAMLCDTPQEVDATVQKIKDNGYVVVKEPWDAFWGQRYAIVQDPDGYLIDLFANLSD